MKVRGGYTAPDGPRPPLPTTGSAVRPARTTMSDRITIEFDAFAVGCLPLLLELEIMKMRAQAERARARGEEAHTQKMLDLCVGQLESCRASVVEARRRHHGRPE